MYSKPTQEINLLKFTPVNKLYNSNWFPYSFQIILLFVFIVLIYVGWNIFPSEGMNDKLFAKTNIVTNTIWALWWPSMIWISIIFGRIWCAICPLELVSTLGERISEKIGIKKLKLNKWVRNGIIIVFLYVIIQLLVAGVHIHRTPAFTSYFLLGLLSLAIVVGILFNDRAFCRGFCPVGLLLNVYGRGGIIALRATENGCTDCHDKKCITYKNENLNKRSCPSLLNPSQLKDNADCLLCGQCIKVCKPGNLQISLRTPFYYKDKRTKKADWIITLFVIILSGFVTYELTTEWAEAKKIFLFLPDLLTQTLDLNEYAGFIKGIWTLFIFPAILWLILGLLAVAFRYNKSIFDAWKSLVLPSVIIIGAGHMFKAVAKFVSWVSYFPWLSSDPIGFERTAAITFGTMQKPESFFGNVYVAAIGLILLSCGFYYAVKEENYIDNQSTWYNFTPKIILFLFYAVLIIGSGIK